MPLRRNPAEYHGAEHEPCRHLADDRRLAGEAQHGHQQPYGEEDDGELHQHRVAIAFYDGVEINADWPIRAPSRVFPTARVSR